jgi:sporulation protein YlmC with PRC-barrel domain
MERNTNSLIHKSLEATDGVIGEVEDFYFDDNNWKVRYLVVKTGTWLNERKVLISPQALLKQPWDEGFFPVNLTKSKVEKSPDIDTDKPVSRQQEAELYGHYQWGSFEGSGFYAGGSMGVSTPFPVFDNKVVMEAEINDKRADDDVHLRSTARIAGYHVHAKDGEIGHVKDFIIDDETWQLKAIVVDTHNWLGGKKVLIPVGDIKKLQWSENLVYLTITKSAVNKSPAFEETNYLHLPV